MRDQRRDCDLAPDAAAQRLTRRQAVVGPLMAGTATLFGGAEAWAQAVPLHCVPPSPGTVPVNFVPALSQPIRTRKSVFELTPTEITRLKSAYAALRRAASDLRDDPRGWYQQGLVHCWYCSGALDSIWGPEIHGGWYFLPWHRAYLHFHEQILGELIGDPSFTLPYWDWDSPGRNVFPPAYMTPPDQTNSLFDPSRAVTATTTIPANLTGPARMTNVMGSATFALFAGAGEGASGQMGAIEGAPHGGVHLWVTNPATFTPPQVNMGVLGTAAFDPVFFAHHANIDRLWQVWIDTQATPAHANPSEDAWTQQTFVFYDQRRQWTQIAVGQVVDSPTNLRYRYQPPQLGGPTPTVVAATAAATPPRSAPARITSTALAEIATTPNGTALTPSPQTVRVNAPPQANATINALSAAPGQRRVVLHIEGVQVPGDRAAFVNVFLNQPNATAATPTTDPGFVGSIVLVPSTVAGGHAHKGAVRNFAFDVSERLKTAPPPANGELAVTLVPAQGDGSPPGDIRLSYKRIYLATE